MWGIFIQAALVFTKNRVTLIDYSNEKISTTNRICYMNKKKIGCVFDTGININVPNV